MQLKHLLMVTIALAAASCCHQSKQEEKTPITKPQITIEGNRLTPEALWAMGRIGTVVPDVETGLVAYTVSYYSITENRSTTWIRIACEENGKLITKDEFVGNEPAWFGNSGVLVYIRQGKLFLRQNKKDIAVNGFDQNIEGFLLSPMRDHIVLISQIKTMPSTSDKYADLPLASGRIVNDLMYKHWDEWTETAPQPFVAELDIRYKNEMDIRSARLKDAINILEGTPFESPMKPFGGIEQLAWAPDNQTLAYTCRKKSGIEYAISTNSDIYTYNIIARAHKNITEGMMGYDTNPMYSPNGQFIAWQSMEHDGYESDENRLFIMNITTGAKHYISRGLGTNVDSYFWKNDEEIVFSACKQGTIQLYKVNISAVYDVQNATCEKQKFDFVQLTNTQSDHVPCGEMDGGIYLLRHSMQEANEIYRLNEQTLDIVQLTHENQNIYDQVEMGQVVPRWQTTTDGKQMLTWIIYPPHFDATRKYPTLLYCEGGPQSPVSQFWSYRWNFMMMSANDYIVVAPNRRGLPGFGNEWNEAISGDYGGQCMKDLLTAIDEFAASENYVDKDHLGCVGASFGGYSVYWLAGHHNKRFKAFIAHDGIFNIEMQYLETEEKWFANWDLGGAYWEKDNAIAQRTYANSPHKFVDQWDTPILCVHGEKDYRILANQAMAAFDAAKLRNIDAELLIFPDENHWVLQPQNGILWQRTFFEWLDKYLKSPKTDSL